jgi:hypothetical protein
MPRRMAQTLTWDRGPEMTRHRDVRMPTKIPGFFGDAYCPGNAAAARTPTAPAPVLPEEDRHWRCTPRPDRFGSSTCARVLPLVRVSRAETVVLSMTT